MSDPDGSAPTARFDAFISYSHAADGRLAPLLQRALERLARPWYRRRALRVFRDDTGLAVTEALWPSIESAVHSSRHFVLLASPGAVGSEWVDREVRAWLERGELPLLVLTEGDIEWDDEARDFDWNATDSLPRVLAGRHDEEPFWLDLRWARSEEELSLEHPRFLEGVAAIGARIHGRSPDEMVGDAVREHRRTMRIAWSAGLALALLALVSVLAASFAARQRDDAIEQARIAQARQLVAQAELTRNADASALTLSTLLAVEAVRRRPTPEATALLRSSLGILPRLVARVALDSGATPDRIKGDGSLLVVRYPENRVALVDPATGGKISEWEVGGSIALRISPDGRRVAHLSFETVARYSENEFEAIVRDAATGEIVARVPYVEGLSAFGFSPDARHLVISRREVLRFWDIAGGRESHRLVHPNGVTGYRFSPDGDHVAVGTFDGFYLWRIEDERVVVRTESGEISDVAFRSDGRYVAAASADSTVYFFDTETGASAGSLATHDVIESLEFSPGAHVLLATSTEEGTLSVWDLQTFREVWRRPAEPDGRHLYEFSADGEVFVTSGPGAIQTWETATGVEKARLTRDPLDFVPTALAFGHDGHRLLVAAGDGIRTWEPVESAAAARFEHGGRVVSVAFDPSGTFLMTGGSSGDVQLWEVATGRQTALILPDGPLRRAEFDPSGDRIATATFEVVQIWAVPRLGDTATYELEVLSEPGEPMAYVRTGGELLRFEPPGSSRDLAFGPTGGVLAIATDSAVQIRSAETGEVSLALPIAGGSFDVDFHPAGDRLATAGTDSTARIWDLETGAEVWRRVEPMGVGGVRYGPEGRVLAIAYGPFARVVRVSDGEVLHTLRHERPVFSLDFSPDGKLLLTGSGSTVTRATPHLAAVWDLETGEMLARIEHAEVVYDAAFSPDGRTVASGSWDESVRLWRWTGEDLVAEVCARLTRNLHPDEWTRYVGAEPYRATCPRLPLAPADPRLGDS